MAAGKSDYYDILAVDKAATAEEIKKSYRRQALEWHPDKHKDNKEAAEKRFKEINEAYQVLADPEKRRAYDQFGHQAFAPGGGRGANPFAGGQSPFGSGQGSPFTYTYSTSGPSAGSGQAGFDFGDPFEIFEQFFGGGSPFGRAQRVPRYSISIDFMEAVKGVEKEVSINGKKRKIKIPAGVDEGSRIQFDDFTLSVDIKPHEIFERDGADIYVRVEITYSLATLGGYIEIPTVDDPVKIKVRAGTKSGSMIRLRERGVKHLRGGGRGDEYVRLVVGVSTKLTREQKRLVSELKEHGL
jgi:DnaJ-class molecular chaperone